MKDRTALKIACVLVWGLVAWKLVYRKPPSSPPDHIRQHAGKLPSLSPPLPEIRVIEIQRDDSHFLLFIYNGKRYLVPSEQELQPPGNGPLKTFLNGPI